MPIHLERPWLYWRRHHGGQIYHTRSYDVRNGSDVSGGGCLGLVLVVECFVRTLVEAITILMIEHCPSDPRLFEVYSRKLKPDCVARLLGQLADCLV